MVNQELIDYIKGEIEARTEIKQIEDNLIRAGWLSEDIKEGFTLAGYSAINSQAFLGEDDFSGTDNISLTEDVRPQELMKASRKPKLLFAFLVVLILGVSLIYTVPRLLKNFSNQANNNIDIEQEEQNTENNAAIVDKTSGEEFLLQSKKLATLPKEFPFLILGPSLMADCFEGDLSDEENQDSCLIKKGFDPDEVEQLFNREFFPVFKTSLDTQSFVYITKDKEFVVINETRLGPYDELAGFFKTTISTFKNNFIFSQNSDHLAFVARKGSKNVLVLDGEELGYYDSINEIIFSPNGDRFAYAAVNDNKMMLVVDGEEVRSDQYSLLTFMVPSYYIDSLIFNYDGASLAYIESKGVKKSSAEKGYKVVLNNESIGQYTFAGLPTFNSDGQHFAYVSAEGESFNKMKTTLHLDDKEVATYSMGGRQLSLSPDGKHIAAFLENDKEQIFLHLDNKLYGPYDRTTLSSVPYIEPGMETDPVISIRDIEVPRKGEMIFSSDSKRFAYSIGHNLLLDGHLLNVQKDAYVEGLVFSPDSKKLAYKSITKDGEFFMMIDNNQYGPYANLSNLFFSPDNQHYIYFAQKIEGQKSSVFIDGKEKEEKYDFVFDVGMIKWGDDYSDYFGTEKPATGALSFNSVGEMSYVALIDNEVWRIVDKLK